MESHDIVDQEAKYAKTPIPNESRKNWIGVAAIYFGMTASLSAFATGGALISGLTLAETILATIIGTAILVFLFYIPTGYIGVREGLNTYMIGESSFGTKGSNIATAFVISIIPNVGWYGVQVAIATDAITGMFGSSDSFKPVIMITIGIIFALPAMFGIISMAWLDYLAVPAILFITIFGFTKAMNLIGAGGLWAFEPATSQSLVWGINLLVGSLIVGATFTADYTRWNENKLSKVGYSGLLGIAPALLVLTIIAAMMGISATSLGNVDEPWNIAEVLTVLGLPSMSLILIVIMQWTTNITSSYSAGLAFTKVFGWSRFWWTLIAALLGTLLSLLGIIKFFMGFLALLAVFVAPAAGVIISEYYLVSKGKLKPKEGFYWPGLISWALGGIGALLIPFFIPAINAFVIAGIIYYLYHVIFQSDKS